MLPLSPCLISFVSHSRCIHQFVCVSHSLLLSCPRRSQYFNGARWQLFHCYYFAFVSFSTLGFGDFALGPTDSSVFQFFLVLLQVIRGTQLTLRQTAHHSRQKLTSNVHVINILLSYRCSLLCLASRLSMCLHRSAENGSRWSLRQ